MVAVAIALLLAAMAFFSVNTAGTQINVIEVMPGYEFYLINSTFDVSIYCIPTEPVKAFEFKLQFDPTKLQALSVQEGEFFAGYVTFFRGGEINNTAGTIINIYDLIIGQGNITTPGTLVTVTFRALNETGASDITIYDEGICNETKYLKYQKNNGIVQTYTGCPPWDVAEDGIVDLLDVSGVLVNYGSTCAPGNERWDVNQDGVCDLTDLGLVISHYGETY